MRIMLQSKNTNIVLVVAIISFINVLLLIKMQLFFINVIIMFVTITVAYLRPDALILLFLIATSTVTAYSHFPKIKIAEVDLFFTDVLLILAFVMLVLKYNFSRIVTKFKNPMAYSLIAFTILVILSIGLEVKNGDFSILTKAIATGRPLLYYLLFIPIVVFINDEKKLMSFIKVMIILSIVISIYIIFTAAVGKTIIHQWFKAAIVKNSIMAVDAGNSGMVVRHGRLRDIPGISYIIITLPMVIGLLMYNWKSKSVKLYYTTLFLGIIVIIVNFTRMVWVSYILITVIMLFITRGKEHRYIKIGMAGLTFVFVITISLMFVPKYSNARMVTFMSQRLLSFFVENVSTQTAVQRIVETKAALEEIETNYLWGIGISRSIESSRIMYNDRTYILNDISNLHNSYLNIIFKIGIFPFIAYMTMSIIFLRRSYRLFKTSRKSYVKGLSIGLFLSYLRVMLNAISQHYFWHISSITPIVVIFALNEVLIELDSKDAYPESKSTSLVQGKRSAVSNVS